MKKRTVFAAAMIAFGLLAGGVAMSAPDPVYTVADFARVRKLDAHVHDNTADPAFLNQARKDGFDLLSINVDYPDFPPIDRQFDVAQALRKADPQHFHFAATFSMDGWGKPGWAQHVSDRIRAQAAKGAVAVKIWKNVGLAVRDKSGRLVMLDDPGFDPVIRTIEAVHIPLIDHQGEPRNCWLPLKDMTTENDREYFTHHPQYYMYLHPDMPSYETLMAARDRFVSKNPRLSFVGAHMASLEWDVDRLAAFLDAHPNANVDLAARLSQVQAQSLKDPAKVRRFFVRYAGRLIYGSDLTVNPGDPPAAATKDAHDFWLSDWIYLATGAVQNIDALHRDVKGLALPRAVIDQIYWSNGHRVFSRIGHGA